jgi:putative methionine-R-sulfoxide reductase with GAF domain
VLCLKVESQNWRKQKRVVFGDAGLTMPLFCRTKSEIVVPLIDCNGELLGVLDVDSNYPAAFTTVDKEGLEKVCKYLRDQPHFALGS